MHTPPPQEDPREVSEIHLAENYSLPQRRRRSTASELPSTFFHTDEHPEIPKIQRASRPSGILNDWHSTPAKRRHRANKPKPPTGDQTASENKQKDKLESYHVTRAFSIAQHRRSALYTASSANRSQSLPSMRQGLQRTQKHQRKQGLSLVTSFQRYTRRQKLITVGGIMLTVVLLILAGTTTFHQLSAKNAQEQTNNLGSNPMILHGTTIDKSHQVAVVQQQNDHPAPPVLASSAYLLDADTGATLYASHSSLRQPMLSTTKLMTALVATQIGDPNQSILINNTITNDINQLSADSSLMGIKNGEIYTLKDLLYGLLLVSGNDAAVAIADQLGGGNQQSFVDKMNQEAVKLGLLDTHYVNPHGLLATGQFSSAHDLALLAKSSLNVPLIHLISSTREYNIPKNEKHDEHDMVNTNQFLWWYPGVDGGKPGWDDGTDFVQVISCVRNHRHLIGVVMHSVDWWTDMRDLMNWGFNTFDWISPHDAIASEPIPYATDWHYFDKDKKETTIPTPDQGRYYIYTGYSISGPIMAYFDANGGLNTFGFPTSQAKKFSNSAFTQHFEHKIIICDQDIKQCMKT